MHIVLVHVHVKPEYIDEFKNASVENAQNSYREAGIARFDVIQSLDDPTRFILVEVYRSIEDTHKHKETDHYTCWRDAVTGMMAEPREGKRFTNIYPDDSSW